MDVRCYYFTAYHDPDREWYIHNYGAEWCKVGYEPTKKKTEGNTQKLITEINSKGAHVGVFILTNSQLKAFGQRQLDSTNIMDFLVHKELEVQNMNYREYQPQLNLFVFHFREGNKVVMK